MNLKLTSQSKIKGKTIIDHRILNDSGLTCTQYVLLSFLDAHAGYFDVRLLWKEKGIIYDARIHNILKGLSFHDWIVPTIDGDIRDGSIIPTGERWKKYFDEFDGFDEFWTVFKKTGNKQAAIDAYPKALKILDKEELLEKAKLYIINAEACGRFLMHASSWLSPKFRHWDDELPVPPAPKKEQPKEGYVSGRIFDDDK